MHKSSNCKLMHLASLLIVVSVGQMRCYAYPDYHSADTLLYIPFYFMVLTLVSGTFGPGILEWQRWNVHFLLISRNECPLWFYFSYIGNLLIATGFLIYFFWVPAYLIGLDSSALYSQGWFMTLRQ